MTRSQRKTRQTKQLISVTPKLETDLLEDRNSAFEKFRLNYINLLHIILFNGNHLIFPLTFKYLFRLMEIDAVTVLELSKMRWGSTK